MTNMGFCRIPPRTPYTNLTHSLILYRTRAKYDNLVKSLTLGTWICLTLLDLWLVYIALIEVPPEVSTILMSLALSSTIGPLIISYLFAPRSFELTPSGIIVRRALRSFEIPYEEIIEVRRISWSLWFTLVQVRVCGSGGLYGFYGLFKLKNIGKVWLYVTNRHNAILIKTKEKQYIISPGEPEEFLRKLNEFLKVN